MPNRTIYLANLPYKTDKAQITTLVQPRIPQRITLVHDRATGRPTGFGFVEFFDPDDAVSAVKTLDGISFGGRTLRCSMAKERGGRQ